MDGTDDVRQETGAVGDAAPVAADPEARDAREEEAATLEDDELSRARAERDEYLELARRVQAEFENYRKRMTREQTALIERATERLVEELLPVLDAFDLALLNLEGDERVQKGVELVYAELLGVLERNGLARIGERGEEFDPNEHEAVMQEERAAGADEGPPVVADVMRAGYRVKGRVLRPAMVKVAR